MAKGERRCGIVVACCALKDATAIHVWSLADIRQLQYSLVHPHIVDSRHYNVLMRIGNPAVYSLLGGPNVSLPALAERLGEKAGDFFPPVPFELLDVSLLGEPGEGRFVALERQAFGDRLFHWPSRGLRPEDFRRVCEDHGVRAPESMQPRLMSHDARRSLARDHERWDPDHLERRVRALRALLEERGPRPRVVFFHGMGGGDRTGALFAAYSLRYRNRSLTEVIAENELIARRHMSYKHQVAAQWYCEYLVSRGQYSRGYDCGNCSPYRCQDGGEPWDPCTLDRLWFLALTLGAILASFPTLRRGLAALSRALPRRRKMAPCGSWPRHPTFTPPAPRTPTTPPPLRKESLGYALLSP